MYRLIKSSFDNWPYFAGLISIFMLAAAHAFEIFMKLAPCALCLHQREVYWAALSVSAIAILTRKFTPNPSLIRAFDALLAVIFFAGAVVAGFHVGVELHWWPGLPECAGAGKAQIEGDLLSALSKPMIVPKCDDIPWELFGISMAGYNFAASLILAFISLFCALKGDTGAANFNDMKEEI